MATDITTPRPCKECGGKGEYHDDYAHYNPTTRQFTPGIKKCHNCDGKGEFPGLEVKAILDLILTKKGGKRSFRKSWSWPKGGGWGDRNYKRAYHVWRYARFHGGADVTMPCTANMLTGSDPFEKELDAIADWVASKVFGTNLAAAFRWGRALGYINGPTPAGLPASAHEGGPVADENKPEWERLELL